MTPQEEILVGRCQRTFGLHKDSDVPIQILAFGSRLRAVVGPRFYPESDIGRLAESCFTKLSTGDKLGPSPAEFAALEYAIRAARPAPLIRDGVLKNRIDDDFLKAFPSWDLFNHHLPKCSGAVGCLFRKTDIGSVLGQGTAFLVSENIVLTNAHVLDALSYGVRQLEKGHAIIRWKCEIGMLTQEQSSDVIDVLAVHDRFDACLLRVESSPDVLPLTLSETPSTPLTEVAAIGFPYRDDRNPAFVDAVFDNRFGFKRAAPGLITDRQLTTDTIFHDCTTLGGNSGSPLICMKSALVLGVHTGGGFMWKNTAIDASKLSPWILDCTHNTASS